MGGFLRYKVEIEHNDHEEAGGGDDFDAEEDFIWENLEESEWWISNYFIKIKYDSLIKTYLRN